MDLPTYTNIWRIEKRLYKLYDFRLPAPLPINWIAVFAGITVPYILLLVAIGLPFNHTLVWLYVLPPGLLTWLTTRPVIEGKRLPELVESQFRYLTEPRSWCRMAPATEKDQVMLTARVWHSHRLPRQRTASMVTVLERGSLAKRKPAVPVRPARVPVTAFQGGTAHGAADVAPATAGAGRLVTAGAAASATVSTGTGKRSLLRGRATGGTARGERASGTAKGTAKGSAGKRLAAPVVPAPPLPANGVLRPRRRQGGQDSPAAPGALPFGSVPAPVPATQPEHATPAVVPVVPALAGGAGGPVAGVSGTAGSTLAGTAAASAVRALPTGPDEQLRARGVAAAGPSLSSSGEAGPRVEVAHNGPAHRPVPRVAPADPARAWPSVGYPGATSAPAPVPPLTPVPATEPASAERRPAPPPADRGAARQELFTLLAGNASATTAAAAARPAQAPAKPATPPAPATPPTPAAPASPEPVAASAAPVTPMVAVPPEPAHATPPVTAHEAAAAPQAPAGQASRLSELPAPSAPTPVPVEHPAPAPQAEAPAPQAEAPPAEEPLQRDPEPQPDPEPQRERSIPSIERALSGPARDRNLGWHAKVKIVTGTGQGPGSRDQEALDRARARLPLNEPKRVLVLGCTSGAGQTVTALMTGHILASLREEPVAAVDLHDGTLGRYAAPAAWLREVLDGAQPQGQPSGRPDGLPPKARGERHRHGDMPRLDVIASDDPLLDGDERRLAEHLGRHYPLTILDPGATGLTRLLKIADQLVLVAPASVEAASALADTRDWLDAHGFAELALHSVTLLNGVSRRSLPDVEAAEAVARGRCRAIVRVPWDDMLPVGVTGPSTLHPQTRVAYTALAGVLVAGMAAAPVRRQ